MHILTAARAKYLSATLLLAGGMLVPFSGEAQAPAAPVGAQSPPGPSGMASAPLFANERVSAIKLSFAPGARESLHVHPFDIMVIQLTAGDVDLSLNGVNSTSHIEPGRVTYIPAQAQHSAGNSGKTPFDMVVVALR